MAKVIATIDKLGRVKSDPQGYTGTDCERAIAPIKTAFRGANIDETDRPELHQTSIETEQTGEQELTN